MKLISLKKNKFSRYHFPEIMINLKISRHQLTQIQKIANKTYWFLTIKQRKF